MPKRLERQRSVERNTRRSREVFASLLTLWWRYDERKLQHLACFETLIWFFYGVTVLAQPYVFSTPIEHAFSTDDSTRYIRTLS